MTARRWVSRNRHILIAPTITVALALLVSVLIDDYRLGIPLIVGYVLGVIHVALIPVREDDEE